VNRFDAGAGGASRASADACRSRAQDEAAGQKAVAARPAQAGRFGNPESNVWHPSSHHRRARFEDSDKRQRSFELYSFGIVQLHFEYLCFVHPIAKRRAS
jgi:hypothetical protein